MRKMISSVLLLSAAISCVSYGQARGTGMLWLPQPESPAILVETNHTRSDFLHAAKLKNVSDHSITAYRIGWVAVYPSGRNKVGLGLPVDVPEGIKPGEVVAVPAQQVSPDFAREGASALVFFITDVHSAKGPTWSPILDKVEQEARELQKAVGS